MPALPRGAGGVGLAVWEEVAAAAWAPSLWEWRLEQAGSLGVLTCVHTDPASLGRRSWYSAHAVASPSDFYTWCIKM